MLRDHIPEEVRLKASQKLFDSIFSILPEKGNILSFVSFGSEIDTTAVNRHLLQQERLLLPSVQEHSIQPYSVDDLDKSLIRSKHGHLEPVAERCLPVDATQIVAVLVPGLAFDEEGFRLGYGRGHYDRFLGDKRALNTIGVGFSAQMTSASIPREPHDIPVKKLALF